MSVAAIGVLWSPAFSIGCYLPVCTNEYGLLHGIATALMLGMGAFVLNFPSVIAYVLPLAFVLGLFAFGLLNYTTGKIRDAWIASAVIAAMGFAGFLGASVSSAIRVKCF